MTKKIKEPMTTQEKIITGVIVLVGIFLLFSIFSAPTSNSDNKKTNVNMNVLMDDDSIKGNSNAPITIIEFSDYECPACSYFFKTTMQELRAKYIDTGIVKFVYRDFPLTSIHSFAQKSAEAAECAGNQNKYYEMHDKLFTLGVEGGISSYKEYAKDLKLNSEEFNECLDSGQMAIEVSKDILDGQMSGVTGTPAFFVNGIFISGAQPISIFDKIIEEELKK